jgi:hypothetical protein
MYQKILLELPSGHLLNSFSTHPIFSEVVVGFSLTPRSLLASTVTTIARKLTYPSENREQGRCLLHSQS